MTTGPLPSISASLTGFPMGSVSVKSGALLPTSTARAGTVSISAVSTPTSIRLRMVSLPPFIGSVDHAVRPDHDIRRNGDAQALRGRAVHRQLDLVGALDGKIARASPAENLRHESGGLHPILVLVGAIRDEGAGLDPKGAREDRGSAPRPLEIEDHARDVHGPIGG